MAVTTFEQTNFTAGQLGEDLVGRTDLSKYYNGLSVQENFISKKQGPICRRPGTKYVAETKSSQAGSISQSRLIPFQFSDDQTYQLEFGDKYIRFYLNRGRLLDDGTVKAVGADADSPFELTTPYSIQPAISASPTGFVDTPASTFNSVSASASTAPGIVTVTSGAQTHGMSVGDRFMYRHTSATPVAFTGVSTVRTVSDTATFTFAHEDAAAGAVTEIHTPNIVTVTFASDHGFPVGAIIDVSGTNPSDYNGRFSVMRVPSATTLVYQLENVSTPADSTSGTVTMVDSDVSMLDYAQSADVLFLTHPNVRPKELQRKFGFSVTEAAYDATEELVTLTIGTDANPHGFQFEDAYSGVYSKIIVSGMTPTGYNGCFTVQAVTPSTISYTKASDPGSATAFGTVDGWQLVNYDYKDGPYLDSNDKDDVTLNTTGGLTVEMPLKIETASSVELFTNTDIDRLVRMNVDSKLRWGILKWFVDPTEMRVEQDGENNSSRSIVKLAGTDTGTWRLGAWSYALGWPRTVNFIQSRLMFGGNDNQSATFWTSRSNSINYFDPDVWDSSSPPEVTDANAITATIDDDQVNTIYWLSLTPQGMLIGTDNAEFLLHQRAKFDPLTPSNTVVSAQSFLGSKQFVKPVKAGNTAIIFVQKAGREIYQMLFDIDSDNLKARDITQLSSDITRGLVGGLAYQQEPNPIIWAYLEDGTLIGCTYELDEEAIGWHKHPLGGTNAKVKSISTISDTSGTKPTDQLWMIVSRTIDGGTVEYIEYIEDGYETDDDLEDAIYMDSSFTYDSTPTTTINDLDHLEDETVKVFADGVAQADKKVISGSITISSASTVHVGLSYTSKMATMPIELRQSQPESNQKIKRLERANVSFMNSQGVQFGMSETDLEDVAFSDTTSLHTTLIEDMSLKSPYERNQKLWIVNSGVFPTTVRSIEIDLEVQPIQD